MAKEFAKGLYNSAAWKRCRLGYIQLRFCICEHCGKAIGTRGIVHHKIALTPQNVHNPEVTLSWNNLKYLCTECHNAVDVAGVVREDVMFDANGDLISRPEPAKPPPILKSGLIWSRPGSPPSKNTQVAREGGCGIRRMEMEKRERIETEKKRLIRVFTKVGAKEKKAVSELMANAAFMSVTLQDLQDGINKKGTVVEYKNGENQWGTKKNPDVETYNTMIKNYTMIIKQLTDLLPKEEPSKGKDEFDKFVDER